MTAGYQLLDSGHGRKLERFSDVILDRPCGQAVWRPLNEALWECAAARFTREQGWEERQELPSSWTVRITGLLLQLKRTPFGHVGIFPEQVPQWEWVASQQPASLLNLFGYSGGMTLAAAHAGSEVCHVDASSGMVEWARDNAALGQVSSVRWIVDDVRKFCAREERRGRRYRAIVLDPPSFGRGARGEVFKIDDELPALLAQCSELLERPGFLLLSCHTPGYTPLVLEHLLRDALGEGHLESGEMVLPGERPIPSGSYCRWSC